MNLQIGKIIKDLRLKHGITQEVLAERLGISPQSVSKWERNEGYPDITTIIPIAEYFGISLDELMGVSLQRKELKIQESLSKLREYNHSGDCEKKNIVAKEAYAEFPYDFRIISWYIVALLDTENPQDNQKEIERLASYVLEECTDGHIRCEITMSLIELYKICGDYDKALKYSNNLNSIQYSKEFARCFIYPWDSTEDFLAAAKFIDECMERILWLLTRISAYKKNLTLEERIEILEKAKRLSDVIYNDFELGMFHGDDIYLSLFRFYSELGKSTEALYCLENAFKCCKVLDECSNTIIQHTSQPLCGSSYDMQDTWSGNKSNAVWRMFELLESKPYHFPEYDKNKQYGDILSYYRPYALEEKIS